MGSDLDMPLFRTYQVYFQFTPPAWGAIFFFGASSRPGTFQFTFPVWGATTPILHLTQYSRFSIHAPCVGVIFARIRHTSTHRNFNSRSPCGERHRSNYYCDIIDNLFNSHSPHGERRWTVERSKGVYYFNSRSPHGERHLVKQMLQCNIRYFNSHSLRGEWWSCIFTSTQILKFQFTLPRKGSDRKMRFKTLSAQFSIHALRMGSDLLPVHRALLPPYFNSRSLRGER